MFSNLSKGSVLNGIDKRNNEYRWFTGSVENITPSISPYGNVFSQFPSVDLDISVNINGDHRVFKGLHSNDTIADFGPDTFILADNKDSLYNYIKSKLKESEEAVDENIIKKHKERIPKYRGVLSEMVPGSTGNQEVKELKEQVGNLQSQLAEALALLKQKTAAKEK